MQSKPIGATNPPVFRLQGCLSSSSKSRKISALAQMGEVCQPPVVSAQNSAPPAPPAAQVAQTLSKHEPQSGAGSSSEAAKAPQRQRHRTLPLVKQGDIAPDISPTGIRQFYVSEATQGAQEAQA